MDNRSHFRSLDELIRGLDRERALERTTSTGDMDKFQEAICAFANDLANSRKKGYLILRAYDNGGKVGGKVGGKTGGDVVENVVGKDLNDVAKPSDVVGNVVENKENVVENILASISKNSTISTKKLAAMYSLSERQVQRIMTKLKEQGVIRRIGPDKGGHWEIIAP